jgi:hypothetical protein
VVMLPGRRELFLRSQFTFEKNESAVVVCTPTGC